MPHAIKISSAGSGSCIGRRSSRERRGGTPGFRCPSLPAGHLCPSRLPPALPSQLAKSKESARAVECGDDPGRFKKRRGKLVKHKPVAVGDAILDVNQDTNLEAEADAMAARAMQHKPVEKPE